MPLIIKLPYTTKQVRSGMAAGTGMGGHGHKKINGYKKMCAQKIRVKQITKPAAFMGKGKYMLLQNKAIKAITQPAFALLQKQVGAAQAATNYLQQKQ